ncbi:MAG: hypothetical protein ABFD52_06120 [Acidobacteriota bacterium]
MIVLAITHALICIAVLLYAIKCLKSGLTSLLAAHVIVIVVFIGLGVAIAPFFPLENLAYIGNPNSMPLVRSLTPELYLRQCISHWIFLAMALICLRIEMAWPALRVRQARLVRSPEFWGYMSFVAGVLLSLKYYVFGPGWTLLRETRLSFFSTSDAVTHRVLGYLEAGLGQGSYMASVAAYVLFPMAAAVISLKKRRVNAVLFALAGLFSMMYAFQTRQKAPLLWSILTYVFLSIMSFGGRTQRNPLRRMILVGSLVGGVGAVFLYIVNFGQNLLDAIQGFFSRSFLVPASSETNFFVIFPDSYPFRGISQVFNIPWGRISPTSAVSVVDIARAATGTEYSANASFLAVAWSAAGYLGVIVVSLALITSLTLLDRLYHSVSSKMFYLALALSSVQLVTLISDGLSTYIGRGGLIVPLILILLTRLPTISFKSRER